MRKGNLGTIRFLTIALLVFLGISAVPGGLALILQPDGSNLNFDLSMLFKTPFTNFFIPGIILFLLFGIGSFILSWITYFKSKFHPFFIVLIGMALFVWLTVEIAAEVYLFSLQVPYFMVSIALIRCGWILERDRVVNH